MTITVVNAGTQETWLFSGEHLDHGKWMKGSPKDSIPADSNALLQSEKQDGAAYGTTGWITYISTVKKGSTLTINWNKPYDHKGTTTCVANLTGADYTAKVEDKDFQETQGFCSVIIRKKA
jgi:hypothetical protein